MTAYQLRFPRPLRPGDVVAVTSPSSGASGPLQARLDVAVATVEAAGYRVQVGACMDGSRHVSAPAPERAAELQRMLLDPRVRAVVPPWGGETAIDLVPLLDWDAIAAAEPTWVVGYSDMSTLIVPLTLVCGWATVHGSNLMDTPYVAPDGLATWLDIVALPAGATFTQTSPGRFRPGYVDYVAHPEVNRFDLTEPGGWRRLDRPDAQPLDVSGRLVGGCIETLCNIAGTRYLDTSGLRAAAGDEGLIVYVEAAGDEAFTICRNLHGMRLNGFFDAARAILVGRTAASDNATLSQDEAALDALGQLGVPIVAGVDCGHVAPYLPLVNGALARVVVDGERCEITQTLG